MAEDFFSTAWLEANPEAAFYSAAPFGLGSYTAGNPFGGTTYGEAGQPGAAGGFSPAAQTYWAGQYGNIQRQYLGELGRAMRRGESDAIHGHEPCHETRWRIWALRSSGEAHVLVTRDVQHA